MTSLIVSGAERSGVAILAHALAHAETLPLSDDLALAARRIADGERLVAFSPDVEPDCPQLSALPESLARLPRTRAVVVWRQGVDFVNSRLRARPEQHFVDHCRLWARSLEAAGRLQSRFPDRVALIEFRSLVDRSPAGRERILVPGFKLTSQALAAFLNASAYGRTSLVPQRPVTDAARAAWSMGEVEAFARICGPALQSLGDKVDLAAAARRRPLDLARMLYDRAYRIGGLDIAPSSRPAAAWTLAVEAPGRAQLRLTAVAAGERRRRRLRGRAAAAPAPRVDCEIVESLTRRPLFAASCLQRDGTGATFEAALPAHDGTIEVALVCPGLERGAKAELDLVEARLSYA